MRSLFDMSSPATIKVMTSTELPDSKQVKAIHTHTHTHTVTQLDRFTVGVSSVNETQNKSMMKLVHAAAVD